jgi:hypothetical protein
MLTENIWNVTLKVSLHRDKGCSFRNVVIGPKLSDRGIKRQRNGNFTGSVDPKDAVEALTEILKEISPYSERQGSKSLKRAGLNSLNIEITKKRK